YGLVNHGRALIRNSLISGNRHSDSGDDVNCANRGDSYRYQARGLLLGNGAGNCTADLYVENAETFTRVLAPLADNGGPSPTFALLPASPALDAAVGACASLDQRGAPRPRDGDGDGIAVCDLGAYERQAP